YVNGQFNNTGYINGPVTMSGNIYTRDTTSAHLRSGGFLNNNLWASNTSIFDFGRPRSGVAYSITNDVYVENIDQPVAVSVSTDGWGIWAFQQYYNTTNYAAGTATITNNIFAHYLGTNYNGFAVVVQSASGYPTPAALNFTNNIIYYWAYGPVSAGNHSPVWDQTKGGTPSVLSPNQIYLGPSNTFNTVADPTIYPAPTRSIGSYAGTIGLTATLDGFLAVARDQSKDNWNPALMAAAVNDYVRAGFGLGTSPPPPPPPPPPCKHAHKVCK